MARLIGSALGIATNLYSAEFRSALEASGRGLNSVVLAAAIAAVVGTASTAAIYRWLVARRTRVSIAKGQMVIRTGAMRLVDNEQGVVVGRALHFLEAKRDSDDMIVFLHGLGLDANDFRPYMAESKFHCLAVTLFGLNPHEKEDMHYAPISLRSHVQLLAYGLEEVRRKYPRKRLTLVGFSFSADMFLLLTQYAERTLAELGINKVLLLDPNIGRSTTTISSRIAAIGPNPDVGSLVAVLRSANTVQEFRYLCEYMYKITSKDFAQIQLHARQMVELWDTDSVDQFLDYLGQLSGASDGVHVVLSFNFEHLFNPSSWAPRGEGWTPTSSSVRVPITSISSMRGS